MSESDALLIEERGAVSWLTLNRGDAFNTLTMPLVDALVDYFRALQNRHEIRIVVLQAKGKHFCAGLDLADADSGGEGTTDASVRHAGTPDNASCDGDEYGAQHTFRLAASAGYKRGNDGQHRSGRTGDGIGAASGWCTRRWLAVAGQRAAQRTAAQWHQTNTTRRQGLSR